MTDFTPLLRNLNDHDLFALRKAAADESVRRKTGEVMSPVVSILGEFPALPSRGGA